MEVCLCVRHHRLSCLCVCAGREGQLITSRLVWVMNRERTRSTDLVGTGSDWHELIEGEGSCLIDQNPAQPGDNTITAEITAQVCAQQHHGQLQRNVWRFTIRCYTAVIDLWWNTIRMAGVTDPQVNWISHAGLKDYNCNRNVECLSVFVALAQSYWQKWSSK